MRMNDHFELPLKVESHNSNPYIVDAKGDTIVSRFDVNLHDDDEKAAQIVKAVNWWEDLVTLLRAANKALLLDRKSFKEVMGYEPSEDLNPEIYKGYVLEDLAILLKKIDNDELANSPQEE